MEDSNKSKKLEFPKYVKYTYQRIYILEECSFLFSLFIYKICEEDTKKMKISCTKIYYLYLPAINLLNGRQIQLMRLFLFAVVSNKAAVSGKRHINRINYIIKYYMGSLPCTN